MRWLDFRFLSFELEARARSGLGVNVDKDDPQHAVDDLHFCI
jgi:hypothetical protein